MMNRGIVSHLSLLLSISLRELLILMEERKETSMSLMHLVVLVAIQFNLPESVDSVLDVTWILLKPNIACIMLNCIILRLHHNTKLSIVTFLS